jgi:hypothetical protein
MRLHTSTFALVLLVASVTAADAQVIQRPPRSTGGLFGGRQPADPNRTRQELTFTFDVLGGYDDNLSPDGGNATPDPLAPRRSGTTATVSGGLDYRRGRATRSIEASGRSVVATYRNVGVRPLIGARGTVRAFAQFFEKTTVTGWGEADYSPTFMFGSFTPPGTDAAAPPPDPTGGVTEIRSVNGSGGVSLMQAWNARQVTNTSYTYSRMRSSGLGEMDTRDQTAVLGHSWNFLRNVGLEGSYSLSSQSGGNVTLGSRPLDTHTGSLGLEVRVPISRTRRMTFSGNAGATRVQTLSSTDNLPIEYVTPSGGGSARLDLGRTWALSADANRSVTMLEGLTLQSFVTTAVSVWTGGTIGTRASVSITGTYSEGTAHEGDTGSFSSIGGTAQLQYAVSRCCSMVTSYSYYEHKLLEVAAVPLGFPRNFERNAVRVGMTVWLPLFGTFPADRSR